MERNTAHSSTSPHRPTSVWLEVEVTLTEILIPPPASGSAVPEILISILYLKATETAPAYHPAAQRSLHINRDIVIHLK